MANLAIAPVVNAKLYRHFAAVTFAFTLCVALFANGEAHQAIEDGAKGPRETAKLHEAEIKKFDVAKLGDNRRTHGGFGSDYDPDYGAPSGSGGSSSPDTQSGGTPGGAALIDGPALVAAPAVLSPDEMAKLSSAEQAAYLKKLRGQTAKPPEREVHDLAAIEAASLSRSGRASRDTD